MPGHYQKKSYFISLLSLFLLLTSGNSFANQATPPDAVLKVVADKMISQLNTQRDELKGQPAKVQKLVEQVLLPHIDVINGSKLVLGQYWRTSSKAQKIGFIREFRTLLLRFYSSALADYLNDNKEPLDRKMIQFLPVNLEKDRTETTVRSIIHPKTGDPVPVNYHMHLTRHGWMVYDVSIEGVSVITTYKTSFANEIRQDGIDSLIQSLKERNAKLIANNDMNNPFKTKTKK